MLTPRSAAFVRAVPLPFALTVGAGLAVVAARVVGLVALAMALAAPLTPPGDGEATRHSVGLALGVVVAAAVGEIGARTLAALAAARTASTVKRTVRRRLATHIVALGPGWLRQRGAGAAQASIGDGVEALQAYVSSYLPQAALATIAPVLLVVAALFVDPASGIAAGLAVALLPLTKPLWRRLLGDRSRAHWSAYASLSTRVGEALAGMPTLTQLDATDDRRSRIAEDSALLYRTTRSGLAVSLVAYCLAGVVVGVGAAAVHALAALGVVDGSLGTVPAVVLVIATAEIFRPLLELENFFAAGFHGRAAAEAIADIEEEPALVPGVLIRSATTAPRLRWHGVRFTYPGACSPALRGIDLEVRPGETLALVGRSGAGKSTLIHLLLRWHDPDAGRILIDETPLTDLAITEHRHQIAVVSQDVHLFHRTLGENLRLAAPAATDDDLRKALHQAGAGDLLDTLPEGLATPLGERGARLSGGERQRIALARAFLADAPILVLDEATSALDGRTEAAVMAAVDTLSQDRTTLIIAHRLSTIARADRVAVVDGGEVVEIGTPGELLERPGALARMVDAQSAGVLS